MDILDFNWLLIDKKKDLENVGYTLKLNDYIIK